MILAVCNSKGGVFKTGTTFNLASCLKKHNPVLIDIDSQKSITYLNNIRQEYFEPFNLLTITHEKDLKDAIKSSSKHNLYIMDTEGFDSSLTRMAIISADVLVTPTTGNFVDLLGLNRFKIILQELSEIKKQLIVTNVFINNVNPVTKNFDDLQQYITNADNFELLKTIIRTRADFPNAINKGQAVDEFNPVGKAAQEMKHLAKEVEFLLSL